jgi:plastocyanin
VSSSPTRTVATGTALLGVGLAVVVMAAPAADAVVVKKVQMTNSRTYLPAVLTVDRGTVVTWKNTSFISHTTTSTTGVWSSGLVGPGRTFSHTFRRAGTFRYHCTLHAGMTGRVVVR